MQIKKILLILTITSMTLFSNSEIESAVSSYSKYANNTGILLLVSKNGKTFKTSAGYADEQSKRKVNTNDLFEIGSATKVFTGISIFQLIESGKLSLDTKLNTFYPSGNITKLANYKGKNYWDDVTVGMLLNHTSGFVDYLNVYGDDVKTVKLLGGKDKHFTFSQLIEMSVKFGDANFKPGNEFKYCNTGFIILGDIIEKVTGKDWQDYVQENILDVVGMKNTYFSSRISDELRETMPKGYMQSKETFMAASLASSAGEIISNLDDLSSFMQAWGDGKLYKNKKTLSFQFELGYHKLDKSIENINYGNAIMKIGQYYGHAGQTFGFQSFMAMDLKNRTIYIIGINDSSVSSMNLFMSLAKINYEFTTKQ